MPLDVSDSNSKHDANVNDNEGKTTSNELKYDEDGISSHRDESEGCAHRQIYFFMSIALFVAMIRNFFWKEALTARALHWYEFHIRNVHEWT